ncbi:cyclic nucleotide-binding domain-containing protein (plasmid) [Embleya sp. NBC_00888]|uniref:Crp/Fnr family transcriptional regulator n=1 Tax=Embleya sp. NBC_00888 TaxID=2975960 RepID=UPI002F910EC9|nr:cyclic nucleotide-binding domain-containing protein [Embleya sp. NBC_00888]
MFHATGRIGRIPKEHLDRLLAFGRPVTFESGSRLFEEGHPARNFWLVEGGSVRLDVHVPGRHAAAVETLGSGELIGWSWLFPPYRWHLGAQAVGTVRALEFDAAAVRAECERDPDFGRAITLACAQVIAARLQASRLRLPDLYGPHASADDDSTRN